MRQYISDEQTKHICIPNYDKHRYISDIIQQCQLFCELFFHEKDSYITV